MDKSKICIITTRNIFNSPCLEKYEKIISQNYDILYWDRCNIDEECGAQKYFKYSNVMPANVSVFRKALPYLGFYKYVIDFLRKQNYEKIIIFPTQMAWLMLPWLKGKYKNKYVLDIRDYSNEFGVCGKLTNAAVKNAGLTTITSPAYKNFLPEGDYLVSHNIQEIDKELVNSYRNRTREENAPIVEVSAYAPLVSSTIVGKVQIDPDQILVIKDVDSFFKTNVVSIETDENKHCIAVQRSNYELKNTMFDVESPFNL
jgi:hypothetical protein